MNALLSVPTSPTRRRKVTGYPTFGGAIDEVAIYPAALSAARVEAHNAAGR